jgi:AcrR family transcriptional regulator
MAPEQRRRQLIGIGLQRLAERPIQELSVDAVAAEAGISRGLLFHYFPSKAEYYNAVLDAAVHRTLRTTEPDEDVDAGTALRQVVERFYTRIDRRRDSYLALVFGNGALPLGGDRVQSIRQVFAERVVGILEGSADSLACVHGWFAYLEDRALQWAGEGGGRRPLESEVAHAIAALHALLALEGDSAAGQKAQITGTRSTPTSPNSTTSGNPRRQ